VPPAAAGESMTVTLPALPAAAAGGGETWLTVCAVLAADAPWAPAGHEIAATQAQLQGAAPRPARRGTLDRGLFDSDGLLARIGTLTVQGPRLDLWRAPTDNDHAFHGESVEAGWRALGLDRLRHRVVSRQWSDDELVLRTRVGPAATDVGMLATYRWTQDAGALSLQVDVEPDGAWAVPLPRLGLRLALPASIADVEWFGTGPGEAYADSQQAARVGRFAMTVDALQTPYPYPQENGNRRAVRWAALRGPDGGLRIEGDPLFDLTVRRWTSEQLDAARHSIDLRPGPYVYVNVDFAQNGLGTASCGPGVLPQYVLRAEPVSFSVRFVPLPS
jgi:beta-galactosidase